MSGAKQPLLPKAGAAGAGAGAGDSVAQQAQAQASMARTSSLYSKFFFTGDETNTTADPNAHGQALGAAAAGPAPYELTAVPVRQTPLLPDTYQQPQPHPQQPREYQPPLTVALAAAVANAAHAVQIEGHPNSGTVTNNMQPGAAPATAVTGTIAALQPGAPAGAGGGTPAAAAAPAETPIIRGRRVKREWLWCIVMPSFTRGSGSAAEQNYKRLVSLLSDTFGTIKNDPADPNTFKMPCYSARSRGRLDKKFAYIKVSCSVPKLHEFAEADMIRRRIKRSFGGGFGVFDRNQTFKYVHPGCGHRDAQDDLHLDPKDFPPNDCNCCTVQTYDGKCACCMLKPSNKLDIMRRRIYSCLDQLMGVTTNGHVLAVKNEVIVTQFPLHTLAKAGRGYMSRKQAAKHYFGWVNMWPSALDFTKLSRGWGSYVRDYLGEKVAMYFSFLQSYTTALMVLSIPGVIIGLIEYVGPATDNPGIMMYSIFVSLWATIFVQYWVRRQNVLAHRWDMKEYEEKEDELPGFRVSGDEPRYGFYEPHGEWVDLRSYAEKVIPRHGQAITEWIPKSRQYEQGHLPSCCFTDPDRGNSPTEQEQAIANNTLWWRRLQTWMSASVMLTLVFAVLVASVSLLLMKLVFAKAVKLWGGVIAGVISAIAIELLDAVYQFVALRLNDWENYRTQSAYEEALVYKMVLFQFVNNYFSLFYIAFLKGNVSFLGINDQCTDSDGQPAADCMTELSTQLTSLMLTKLAIGNVTEVGVPWLKNKLAVCSRTCCGSGDEEEGSVRAGDASKPGTVTRGNGSGDSQPGSVMGSPQVTAKLRALDNGIAKAGGDSAMPFVRPLIGRNALKKKPHHAEVEHLKQTYGEGAVGGTFWDYNELLIQFGYVVLFAPAFPLASVISFVSNITENSADGAKLLLETQRPVYAGAENIGTWLSMFRLFSIIGVITNSCIIGFTSHELLDLTGKDLSVLERLIIVVVLEHAIIVTQFLVSVFVSDVPGWLRQIQVRTDAIRKIEDEFESFKAQQAAAGIDLNEEYELNAEKRAGAQGDAEFDVLYDDVDSGDEKEEDISKVMVLSKPKLKAQPAAAPAATTAAGASAGAGLAPPTPSLLSGGVPHLSPGLSPRTLAAAGGGFNFGLPGAGAGGGGSGGAHRRHPSGAAPGHDGARVSFAGGGGGRLSLASPPGAGGGHHHHQNSFSHRSMEFKSHHVTISAGDTKQP